MDTKKQTAFVILQLFFRKVAYIGFCFLRTCAGAVDSIMMHHSNRKIMTNAKLGWIYLRKKLHEMDVASPQDFVCLFRSYVQPEYVLRPNVSLYAITEKEAIFVETPEDINIYSSTVHPFFFVAQFLNARKVIKMPLRDFVCLADRISDPSVSVIWMSNTGRCGGTMLGQMFESVPRTILIHEPDPTTNLHFLHENKASFSGYTYERMLKATIRIICKQHPGIERIFVKPRAPCSIMMTDITKLFPDIKQMFLYRNGLDTIISWWAVVQYDPCLVASQICADTVWFSYLFPSFRKFFRSWVAKLKDSPDVPQDANTLCILVYMWVNNILIARNGISRDETIMAVKYEDVLSKPMETTKDIFERIGIKPSYVDRAVSSLNRDSQRGSALSRDKLGGAKNSYISTFDRIKIDAILAEYNLPRLGEDFRL